LLSQCSKIARSQLVGWRPGVVFELKDDVRRLPLADGGRLLRPSKQSSVHVIMQRRTDSDVTSYF
jgi:hypothetical protein